MHLSEESLDLYLDRGLAPGEREVVEAHLAGCADCRERLGALAGLYGAFAALPAEPLPVDLTAGVMARIAPRRAGQGRLVEAVLAVQAALAALLAFWFVAQPAERMALAWLGERVGIGNLPLAWAGWRVPEWPATVGLPLSLAPAQWSLVALAGAVVWAVVNRALLGQGAPPVRRQERT